MKLKEIMRVLINEEMLDVNVYAEEAEQFGSNPKHGPEISDLFLRLSEEKKKRLFDIGRISKGGTGFRQRKTETSRSVEAALRLHITRAGEGIRLYVELVKLLKKPEYKEAVAAMCTAERRTLADLKRLQSKILGEKEQA
jgi:hypothetical protein